MNLFVHTGDTDIAQMLCEHGVVMQRPAPPNDMAVMKIVDKGVIWLVLRFWVPGDEGYVAYGCPENTHPGAVENMHRMIIDGVKESAAARGKDAFADALLVEVKPETN